MEVESKTPTLFMENGLWGIDVGSGDYTVYRLQVINRDDPNLGKWKQFDTIEELNAFREKYLKTGEWD